MKFSMTGPEKFDLLIPVGDFLDVTTWAALTVNMEMTRFPFKCSFVDH